MVCDQAEPSVKSGAIGGHQYAWGLFFAPVAVFFQKIVSPEPFAHDVPAETTGCVGT
jgi:hypothetical protein